MLSVRLRLIFVVVYCRSWCCGLLVGSRFAFFVWRVMSAHFPFRFEVCFLLSCLYGVVFAGCHVFCL